MQKLLNLFLLFFFYTVSFAQDYTSYFTGNTTDIITTPQGGICLMGGATENDEAMRWFLQRCNGGDVLVLRATGSNGYNDYLYSQLGITVNSVESIVCNNGAASYSFYIQQKIRQAEAIWFAGGDQWDYVSYWRNSPIAALINEAIVNRHVVIGGTSAGMAILGRFYFSAQHGSVSSATALANPYSIGVGVDSAAFIRNTILDSVITDTHYDNPDRRGRQIVFLAKMKKDWNFNIKGIACDEYTAICIDNEGMASVYGNYPFHDDNAYFIQANCEIINNSPETVLPGTPLTWNQSNQALKVYNVKGTADGSNHFSLGDWKTGVGGSWQRWYVINGSLQTATTTAVNCPVPGNLCPGGSTTLVSGLSGAGYQWQVNTGSGFNDISDGINYSGTNTNTLHLDNIPSSWYGYQYNCLVNGVNSNIISLKFSNTWTGLAGTAFEDPANWSCGLVPDSNTDVIINSGTINVNSNAAIRSLAFSPGATFTVLPAVVFSILH
jgi:cyanophycinase-like exopeptidase